LAPAVTLSRSILGCWRMSLVVLILVLVRSGLHPLARHRAITLALMVSAISLLYPPVLRVQLAAGLNALRLQSFPRCRLLIVDNGPTDGSVRYLRDSYPDVSVLALPSNTGSSAGNNRGIESTTAEDVALPRFSLNTDANVCHW
jgi:Glycosyl transferase family 2